MNVKESELYRKVVPLPTRDLREGFDNKVIIDSLSQEEKSQFEVELCNQLEGNHFDELEILTAVRLRSSLVIPVLRKNLSNTTSKVHRVILASSLFELTKDMIFVENAIKNFEKIVLPNKKLRALTYLGMIDTPDVKAVLEKQSSSGNIHLSHCAKSFLKGEYNQW